MLDFSQVGHEHQGLNENELPASIENPLNLPVAKARFSDFQQAVARIRLQAQAVEVVDDGTLKSAVALGSEAKKISRTIETRRKEIIADPQEFIKNVNSFCKLLTDPLAEAESAIKRHVSMYQSRIELERRKQEEAARRAALELQEKLKREAEEANRKAREEAVRKAEEETRERMAKEAAERAKREAETAAEAGERAKREAAELEAARKKAEAEAKAAEIEAPVVLPPVIPKQESVTRTESGAAYQRKSWEFEVVSLEEIPREYLILDEKRVRDSIRMGVREIPGIRIFETTKTILR